MDWKLFYWKSSVCQLSCFHHCFNIFGRLAPSDVVTTPDNQLAWRNEHWINNDLTEKITINMLLKFDLIFWAFFAGGQDGLFYCEYCCCVLFCTSKPRFCLCYNCWEEALVISDFIQRFVAHIHTLLLLLSSVFRDDFTHLLWVFVCVTCEVRTWMFTVFDQSSATFVSGRALKICVLPMALFWKLFWAFHAFPMQVSQFWSTVTQMCHFLKSAVRKSLISLEMHKYKQPLKCNTEDCGCKTH